MYGYYGKIVTIDLSDSSIDIKKFDEEFARKYIGGNGFAASVINEIVPSDTEPFNEKNAVVLALGLLNGTPYYGSGRGHGAAISPQTGYFADSNFGGDFAWQLCKTGFDAVVITGKSDIPVYISIDNGEVKIKSADHIWGMMTSDAHEEIIKIEGPKFQTALIGPAGENKVVYGNIICSGKRVSAAGRGGLGAVLGSKNCKGLAVRGDMEKVIANPEILKEEMKNTISTLRDSAKALTDVGTPVLVNMINKKGKLCTRNNQSEVFSGADKISGEVIQKHYKKKNIACHGCPIACGKLVSVPSGTFSGKDVKMPEYETIYAMGSMLENSDLISIFNANTMCDEMGMDTISFGVTLAFIAECVEEELIPVEHLERHISFGDREELDEYVSLCALKQGNLGEYLAMGSNGIAEELGEKAVQYLYSVKGMEIAGHSARGLRHMGLGYATGTRGGSHHDARPLYYADDPEKDPGFEDVSKKVYHQQHNTAMGDSLVVCRFVQERAFGMNINDKYLSVINAVTGWDMDLSELEEAGERIYNLERLINARRGMTRSADTLPIRVMNMPIPEGPSRGWCCSPQQLQILLDKYYDLRGWDQSGIPTEKTLSRLGI